MHLLYMYFFLGMFHRPTVNLRMTRGRSKHLVLHNKENLVVFDIHLFTFWAVDNTAG